MQWFSLASCSFCKQKHHALSFFLYLLVSTEWINGQKDRQTEKRQYASIGKVNSFFEKVKIKPLQPQYCGCEMLMDEETLCSSKMDTLEKLSRLRKEMKYKRVQIYSYGTCFFLWMICI